ncbi:hypothetical protein SAY86_016082 [Trapa natans]|uniref:PARP-type domain-containing protein n=1 Tax=Trapa natans TaxID=22666 RepID=A0AAN7LBM1_TRANT|nr:hypothetical protein SAY86_016082 [Trapa natans]
MRTTRSLIEPVWISSAIPSFLPLPSPSKGFALFPARGPRFSSMAPPTKTVVEYAKSGRSSCKKCSSAITKDALRVGAVSRDARGFDMTKWHHLGCFSFISLESAEAISGFSSLKSGDQEAIKKLVSACEIIPKTDAIGSEGEDNGEEGKLSGNGNEKDLQEKASKKRKISLPNREAKIDLTLSASDIKDMYKDVKLSPKWKSFETIIFLEQDEGLRDSSKIAAFDFDGCLVNTSVKRVGADAWSLMYPAIPEKLQKLYCDGYKLVIFTNESNIERWKNKRQVAVDSKIGRLNNFIQLVNVPIQVFIACGLGKSNKGGEEDPFRKPKPGMWNIMEKHFNSGIPIDMDKSFYVGDAAGRENDHSDADIKFAQAIGLKFYVPEEYFDMDG